MCAICLLKNNNFCSVPLFWADSVPCPRDQICITTFYHQSNWCCWSILFLGHWNIFIKSSLKNTLSTPDAFINVLIKASLVNKVWPKMHQQRHPFNTYVKTAPNHPTDLIIHKLGRHPWKNLVSSRCWSIVSGQLGIFLCGWKVEMWPIEKSGEDNRLVMWCLTHCCDFIYGIMMVWFYTRFCQKSRNKTEWFNYNSMG